MRKSFKVLIVAVVFLTTCCVTAAAYTKNSKNVALSLYGGETETWATYAETVSDFLEEQKITLNYGDIVSPALDTAISKETKIDIIQGTPVTVYVDQTPVCTFTNAETVNDFLKELQASGGLTEDYLLENVSEGDLIVENMEIYVSSIAENSFWITREIPYKTVVKYNSELPIEYSAVVQEGEVGYEETLVKELVVGGEVISSNFIDSKVLKPTVDCVIEKGSKNALVIDDTIYPYKDAFTVTATGYSRMQANLSDYTYTGVFAERGVIAVDPNVIPLKTKVYVEGYGFASCEDTGSAIKGNRIDLCYDTVEECFQWGIRDVTLYILE